MKRILIATDGSEGADRAIDYAAHQAKDTGAELLIVNVVGGYGLPDNMLKAFSRAPNAWLEEMLTSMSAETLTKERERARSIGVTKIQIESRTGDIVQTIINVAQEKGAEPIVVGKRGNGRIAGLLLGSISQKLASLAPVPVTIVP
jgi:nucleotide-binding universal stress UspA family protein